MMIVQTVKPDRAFLFLKRYAFENAKTYAFLYLAIAAFLVLWLGLQLNFTNPMLFREGAQVVYYFMTLFLSGCLSSGMLFSELGAKPKAIHYLLIPASTLEKFLTSIFFGVIVFFVFCSSIFYFIDFIVVTIANNKFSTHWEVINLFSINKYPNLLFDGPVTDIFYLYFPIQAIFLLCSVYFKKHGLFKAIVGMGLLWVAAITLALLLYQLLPFGRFTDTIASYEIIESSGDNKLIKIPQILVISVLTFFRFLLTPLLWAAAYLRLKEKEL